MKNDDNHTCSINVFDSEENRNSYEERVCLIHHHKFEDEKVKLFTRITEKTTRKCVELHSKCKENDYFNTVLQNFPDKIDYLVHGYHASCYRLFTNRKYLGKRTYGNNASISDDECVEETSSDPKKLKRSPDEYFKKTCFICMNPNKKLPSSTLREHLAQCTTPESEQSIRDALEKRQRTKVLEQIGNTSLFEKHARFHLSCRRELYRDIKRPTRRSKTSNLKEAYHKAFEDLSQFIEEKIITGCEIHRIKTLKERFCAYIQKNNPELYNSDLKTQIIKDKIANRFGNRIQFWSTKSKSELVYSANLSLGKTVEKAFVEKPSLEEEVLDESAQILRRSVQRSHTDAKEEDNWPPSLDYFLSVKKIVPALLLRFLEILLAGGKPLSEKKERLCLSIAQDICFAISNGQWKLPKQIAIGTTVRHLTGSADLVCLLNHFGHSISHSKLLELESLVCNSVVESSSLLPASISRKNNVVTHFCWDNFDLNEETATGSGTTHTAHGIVIQETVDSNVKPNEYVSIDASGLNTHNPAQTIQSCGDGLQKSSNIAGQSTGCLHVGCNGNLDSAQQVDGKGHNIQQETTTTRNFKYTHQELPPCYLNQKPEPTLLVVDTEVKNPCLSEKVCMADFLWVLSRRNSADDQKIPGWAGWVSTTGKSMVSSNQNSNIEYMPPVLHPITENATVQHILYTSLEATGELGQHYALVTFDLAVAKKAYTLVWQDKRLQNVIIRLGTFHLICSYMGAVGKLMQGSGLEEVILQSGICASGSIAAVMAGKHYNRCMRVHKAVLEAIERLLFQQFLVDNETAKSTLSHLSEILEHPMIQRVESNEQFLLLFRIYQEYKQDVLTGKMGKTQQFWLQYAEKIWLILRLLRATKQNDFDLHLLCLQEMCPLLFAMDHQNYARYGTVYFLSMLNLRHEKPDAEMLLRNGGMSVSRSDVPVCRIPVDQSIEQTINRQAKSKGGITGFSRNQSAYFRWCVTRHVRASFVGAALDMTGMNSDDIKVHKDLGKSGMKNSENNVHRVEQSFQSFVDPFQVEETDRLFCLSSGMPAPHEVQEQLINAEAIGKKAQTEFTQERLQEGKKSFHAPLHKVKLKTFSVSQKKVKVTSSTNKSIEVAAQRNLFGQLLVMSQKNDISLQKVMQYPMGPVPWSLATADGMPAKTDKAKLMHVLENNTTCNHPPTEESMSIIDGMALIHSLTTLPATFRALAEKVLSMLPSSKRVDFVTDTYQSDAASIKNSEHVRRGKGETYLLKGPSTKIPKNWKHFLSNPENKTQLVELLLSEWKKEIHAELLQGREIFVTSGTSCTRLTSTDGKSVTSTLVEELHTTQEEADTKIILHCFHQAKSSPKPRNIIVRSPDTDVFIILLHFSTKISTNVILDTGCGNKRRMVPVTDLGKTYGPEQCEAFLGLHAVTGCDSTSSFVRKGKKTAVRVFRSNAKFTKTFQKLGFPYLEVDTLNEIEEFVCRLYRKGTANDVDQLRFHLCEEKFQPKNSQILTAYDGADLSLLPPCRASLRMHVQRANYQVEIWKNADKRKPKVRGPVGRGWREENGGGLEIEWCDGDIMPTELVDILCEAPAPCDDEEDDDVEFNNLWDIIQEDADDEELLD